MRIFLIGCLAACSLYGQTGKISGPSMGFVYDSSAHALRRIQGIPGAALVGPTVDFGFAVSSAYVAPQLDSAFVLGDDGQARFFRLTADAPQERTVDSLGKPQRVVFSPSGSAAALYSPGTVQVVKGLPDAPEMAATIPLRSNVRGRRSLTDTLAISDDGAYLLYSAGGPIELIGVAGNSRQVMAGATGVLAAFAPRSHDAAVVHDGKLTLFQDVAGAATERSFDEIVAPTAVAFSPDSRKVFVASAAGRAVTTIQLTTGDRSSLACDCTPAGLMAMGSVFRLTELGNGPIWVLDTASERGLVFVPAPAGQ